MGWPFDMISQSTKTWDELRFRAGVVYNVKFQVSQPKESSKESPKYNSALVLCATASKNQEDRSPEDKNKKKIDEKRRNFIDVFAAFKTEPFVLKALTLGLDSISLKTINKGYGNIQQFGKEPLKAAPAPGQNVITTQLEAWNFLREILFDNDGSDFTNAKEKTKGLLVK